MSALEGPLPLRDRVALQVHLAMCGACRAYRRQIALIDRLVRLRSAAPPEDTMLRLDAAARERIGRALRRP